MAKSTPACKRIRMLQTLLIATAVMFCAETARVAVAQTEAKRAERPRDLGASGVPKLTVTIDVSEVPEMAPWAARAKSACEKSYPMICGQFASPGYRPPTAVKIVFVDGDGIAYTSGSRITCCAGWFRRHPDDLGAVIHELCHVVQGYGERPAPGWVTEGIADYVRWFKYEPANRRPQVNPETAKYTDGYQTTAAFFDWIVRTKSKSFVRRLNAAAREGKYGDDLFRQYAGKPLDELWAEFLGSLKN
jgi:hypothetical protein